MSEQNSNNTKPDSILLKPKNVKTQRTNSGLKIIYEGNARKIGVLISIGIFLALALLYVTNGLTTYFSISSDNRAAYEEEKKKKIEDVRTTTFEEQENEQEQMELEYQRLELLIPMQKGTDELRESLIASGIEPPKRTTFGEEQTYEEMLERQALLKTKLDSIEAMGGVQPLTDQEIEAVIQDWIVMKERNLEPSSIQFEENIIIPLLVLLGIVVLGFVLYRLTGNNILIVDKSKGSIFKKLDNRFNKKVTTYPIESIKQFYCTKEVSGGDHASVYHNLSFIDHEGEQHTLLSQIRLAEDALYMEHILEQFLEIEHVHVKGSLN